MNTIKSVCTDRTGANKLKQTTILVFAKWCKLLFSPIALYDSCFGHLYPRASSRLLNLNFASSEGQELGLGLQCCCCHRRENNVRDRTEMRGTLGHQAPCCSVLGPPWALAAAGGSLAHGREQGHDLQRALTARCTRCRLLRPEPMPQTSFSWQMVMGDYLPSSDIPSRNRITVLLLNR